ncbi:MAG TPA: hypothetical protein VG604_01255 [Candidatus Saccharimonadales bacterium]|nr:hypothetical protein [Candidatus Saccharimonadales bacterium]
MFTAASAANIRRWAAVLLGLLVASLPSVAAAAPSARNTSGGISLSPFLQQLSLKPGDVDKTFTLILSNHTKALQELDLKSQDFGSLNDTGGILLEGVKSSYAQRYGLASWLSLETDTVVLQPGESRHILVTINNRPDLAPGGHYGAVVASVNSLSDQTGNHVVINQQLLSLVLLDKVGGEHYDLKLVGIEPNGNWFKYPSVVKLHFQNPGNVHVVPRGLVKLKSPTGKVIAQGIINSESAFMLPQTFRDIYVPLTKVGSSLPLPGLYSVEVDYRYDGLSRYANKSVYVRFIDLGLYLLLALVLVLAWRFRKHLRELPRKFKKSVPKPATKKSHKTE